MQVILTSDVARLGKKTEVCTVPDGHALNFLFPRKLAIPATKENMRRRGAVEKEKASNSAAESAHFEAMRERMNVTAVEMYVESNDKGHLFQSVKSADISGCLRGYEIDVAPETLSTEFPIKDIGTYTVTYSVNDHSHQFPLIVLAK